MCFSNREFTDWIQQKAKEIHDETWRTHMAGKLDTGNIDWYIAKEKEILIGEVIRKYQETHNIV